MKKASCFYLVLYLCFYSLFFTGCNLKKLPDVETAQVYGIEPNKAISGGNVTFDGNATIRFRGVCWSTGNTPSIDGPKTTDGSGTGAFTSTLTGLLPNTVYYVKAYATNVIGTSYGKPVTFKTADLSIASLTTTAVSSVMQTTAVSGGNITFDGGSEITERGTCWSTHTNPTIADSKSSDGTGSGSFSSNITGLTGNTKYYVRAYATNSIGTGYGQEISFTSGPVQATLTTTDPSSKGTTTAECGGNITNDGGSTVTARGVCWSTTANPVITNSKTTDGGGSGTFTSSLTGLVPNTRYHVRAYATNSVGTSYGADKIFFTDPVSIQDFDNNDYNVIRIGSQVWLKENLKTTSFNDGTSIANVTGASEWSNLTTAGYCWYNNNGSNKGIYGALYNWYAIGTGKLCPAGWHVPTDEESLALEQFLLGQDVAGGKLKETGPDHWALPNTGATDEVGFTALPGGWRSESGAFDHIGFYGFWWTSTEPPAFPDNAFFRRIQYDSERAFRAFLTMKPGMSVRCIKD